LASIGSCTYVVALHVQGHHPPELQLCVNADAQGDNDLDMPDQEELAQQWKGRVFTPLLPCDIAQL
jgi:hypothetical protein